ncbi:MAG: hypothetical protein LQ344_007174 [Seirophora lacunosa]|nr:MAG: hypothetical protein LQ344_007174 [Seirophora lacunosa]
MLSKYLLSAIGLCALLASNVSGFSLAKRGKSLWCSADESDATPSNWTLDPGFQASMIFYNPNFTDPNPPWKFGFWKSHSKNFRDPYDCYVQCQDCLDRGIRAGLVDTNQVACHYKVKNALISHTCEMGFDRLANDTDEYWAFELAGLGRPWWVLHPPS